MTRAKRFTLLFLCALFLCLILSGCQSGFFGVSERQDTPPEGFSDAILPSGEGFSEGYMQATIYFGYIGEDLLMPLSWDFTLTADTTIEQTILEALIEGPAQYGLSTTALINPNTRVISVKQQHGYLAVTLSNEFLEPIDNRALTESERRMAVYSIVNSLTELGTHSRVLLLVDKQQNGTGARLTAEEAGLSGQGALEPLQRDLSMILTDEHPD